jgi:Spy/CpxP family protein refolding chaperone
MTMRWMPTKRALPWWLLVASLAFNLGFSTTYGVRTYGPIGPGPRAEQRPPRPRWHEPLNLTAEQRQQMRRISDEMFEQVQLHRQEMDEARAALADLVAADEPDHEAIAAQLDVISGLQRQVEELVVARLLDQKQLLGPDQMEAFNQMVREQLFPRRGAGPGLGRGARPGRGAGPGGRAGGGPGRGGRGRGGGGGDQLPRGGPGEGP